MHPSVGSISHPVANKAKASVPWHRWESFGLAPETVLLVVTVFLASLGLVMASSASTEIAMKNYQDSLYFAKRQGFFLVLSLIVFAWVIRYPLQIWSKYAFFIMCGSVLLSAALYIPGVGVEVNGSVRWLNLVVIRLQVSELTKAASLLFLASVLSTFIAQSARQWLLLWPPILLVSFNAALILLQPDLGSVFVIAVLMLGILFVAGLPWRYFAVGLMVCLAGCGALIWLEPYRLERLLAFLNPWQGENPFQASYQLIQSLIGIARGGVFGSGLGASVQKNFYLPEAHTDFIFAVLCEELGILGVLGILVAFLVLLGAIYTIGRGAERLNNRFGAYLSYGVGLLIAIQAFVNIGVNTGMLPTKGLTLPLISYGGTSLLATMTLLGLVYRVQLENRQNLGWSRAYLRQLKGGREHV